MITAGIAVETALRFGLLAERLENRFQLCFARNDRRLAGLIAANEIIEVQSLPDGWCSVAFQSRYDALVVKEKETRQHFDELFARWAQ